MTVSYEISEHVKGKRHPRERGWNYSIGKSKTGRGKLPEKSPGRDGKVDLVKSIFHSQDQMKVTLRYGKIDG